MLFSQTPSESQATSTAVQAPVSLLIKFIERLYRTLPQFSSMAQSPEFIEALAASLFPPHDVGERVGVRERNGENDMIEIVDDEVRNVCVFFSE